jgi:hypothetical protein
MWRRSRRGGDAEVDGSSSRSVAEKRAQIREKRAAVAERSAQIGVLDQRSPQIVRR